MSQKRYVVELMEEERARLMAIVRSSQRIAAKKRMRAQVLLKVDEGEHGPAWTDPEAAEAFNVDVTTVHHIRKQLVLSGWDGALERKERADPPRKRIFDAKGEEEVPAVATGEPPQGRARGTLRLLADEIVRLDIADSVSHETVRTILKKKISSLTVRPDG